MKTSLKKIILCFDCSILRRLTLVAAVAALAVGPQRALAQRPLGVDVSSYQGQPDWGTAHANGVVFAYAKATEGTTINDPDYVFNQNNGKGAGVYMGSYHFAHPNAATPSAEAGHFWSVAGGYTLDDGKTLVPQLDFEVFSGVDGASSYSDWANQWCNDVAGDAAGNGVSIRPVIYVSACNACEFDTSVGGWYAWLANYNGENLYAGNPWNTCTSCEVWGSGVWDMWQVSDTGSIPGISGGVDLDTYNGNTAGLAATMLATASCNLNLVVGAIRVKYDSLGDCNSFLGYPTTAEEGTPDGVGRYNHFINDGSIYWTPGTGAWSIHGAIQDHWASLGWETSPLGYPYTDETGTPDGIGRYNHFTNIFNNDIGSIYWTQAHGAWSIHGAIQSHWASMGWETSVLGYPFTDETGTPDGVGRYNHFTNFSNGDMGSIYYTPNYGAWSIHGSIRDHWAGLGWERSVLGYPVTDETGTPDGIGRFNHFENPTLNNQGGSIYYTTSTGACEVHGPIRTYWANAGWEKSSLGYPTSDQYAVSGSTNLVRNNFQHSTVTLNTTTGAVTSP